MRAAPHDPPSAEDGACRVLCIPQTGTSRVSCRCMSAAGGRVRVPPPCELRSPGRRSLRFCHGKIRGRAVCWPPAQAAINLRFIAARSQQTLRRIPAIRPVHISVRAAEKGADAVGFVRRRKERGYVPPAGKGPLALCTPMTLTRGYAAVGEAVQILFEVLLCKSVSWLCRPARRLRPWRA